MPFVKVVDDRTVGVAQNAPPSAEAELWIEVPENDPRLQLDTEPEQPTALWPQFRTAAPIVALPVLGFNAQTAALNAVLVALLNRVEAEPGLLSEIVQIWNVMSTIAQPTPETIGRLQKLAADCQMPFTLDSAGRMVSQLAQ